MKKIILVAGISILFISCKKDRVCSCTFNDGSIASEATYTHVTKKEAKGYCVSSSANVTCTVK